MITIMLCGIIEKRVSRLFQASEVSGVEKDKIPHFGFFLILLRHRKKYQYSQNY